MADIAVEMTQRLQSMRPALLHVLSMLPLSTAPAILVLSAISGAFATLLPSRLLDQPMPWPFK
jgi:hypothetical protein